MRMLAVTLSLVVVLTIAQIAQSVLHSTLAAWISIVVTFVVCVAGTLAMASMYADDDG